jgi:50S ribosomal protein L16 3-hydroxylase
MTGGWELNLDREQFLARYWQQKPLLIRGAIDNFTPPVSSDELAGLAFEEQIESRIIEHNKGDWILSHGPFSHNDYQREHPWTLLVQAVDHYIDDVAALRKLVDFIPQWRVDDVMVSYASDRGSVGPHYDNYDVFLLQGEGQRLWKTGQFCDASSPLMPHEDLRILSLFEQQEEYLLEPGDMLYVPPGIAHWGIAQGECTTFSLGFRAPRIDEMLSRFSDALLDQIEPDQFYRDARSETATRPGEIRPRDLERVTAQIQAALDQSADSRWFGELVTEPRYEQFPEEDELTEARQTLRDGSARISLNPGAKLAWQHDDSSLVVYANGDSREFPDKLLPLQVTLCEHWALEAEQVQAAVSQDDSLAWLDFLLEAGCIYVDL